MKLPKIFCGIITIAVFCASLGLAADVASKVIDLNKPVIESLKPDGFYWAFDDGIHGEGQPIEVDDLSGNNFVGRIIKVPGKADITYADARFGTGIYAQGLGGMVEWTEKSLHNAASETSKLIMKGQPFTGGVWFKMDDRRPGIHALVRQTEGGSGWRICVVKEIESGASPDLDKNLGEQTEGDAWQLSLEIGDSRFRAKSPASTAAFADGKWHHVGFSLSPGDAVPASAGTRDYTVTYWLDGEIFDTVIFQAEVRDPDPESLSLRAGFRVWGLLDDAFVTTGIHTFAK